MGDADYGGEEYGDYFFEDDWLYIEDEVAFADELAETQIPSPGYAGTNAELMLEWYEYDTFEYFGELEYGSDSYWDKTLAKENLKQERNHEGNQSPRKRKRASTTPRADKRRRTDGNVEAAAELDWQGVVFRSFECHPKSTPIITHDTVAFALFPDWRERFPVDEDEIWHSAMPEDMKRAAQLNGPASKDAIGEEADDEGEYRASQTTQRHEKHKLAQERVGAQDMLSSLDPEALRTILRSKLGDAGLDEEAFMSVINDMLAGGGAADDAIAQLASTLLDQQDDDNADAAAAAGWLQDRGVNMTESVNEAEPSEHRVDSVATQGTQNLEPDETGRPSRPQRSASKNHKRAERTRKHRE
ncbi:hypothetical protein AMS68_001616 [Peltaster fructicola]|uniref:Uncharacterized protein n=1 Tax=Peltaster fructicola TaxID=286661 RepID=A0A6H0XN98_9PEZI|nr:hypothetical protein AMS68_001616 [Peltaster fructicola]